MAIEVTEKGINHIHAPERRNGLVHIGELGVVAQHAHDVSIFVLIRLLVLFESAFPNLVEGNKLSGGGIEVSTCHDRLALIGAEIGILGTHARKGEDVRPKIFGYMVKAPAEFGSLAKLEHVARPIRGPDAHLTLTSRIVSPAEFVSGKVQVTASHNSIRSLLREYHISFWLLLRASPDERRGENTSKKT